MKVETTLIEQAVDANSYLNFLKRNDKKTYKDAAQAYSKKLLATISNDDEKTYFSFVERSCSYFYRIYETHDIVTPIIAVDIFIDKGMSKQHVDEIMKRARSINKKVRTIHFFLNHNSHLNNLLSKVNGKNVGDAMVGLVKDSYDYLKTFDYPTEISFERLKKTEISIASRLEFDAHQQSKSSRCRSLKFKDIKWLYDHSFKKNWPIFVAKENGLILGAIGISISKDRAGHIMTIFVAPNSQKRGISSFLYYRAMKYFKSEGVRSYSGVSSTKEVLRSGKKMGRCIHSRYVEIR